MKKAQIIAAVNALNKIPVSKVAEKEVRYALIDNYLVLRKAASEIEMEKDALLSKFRDEWPAEVATPQMQSGNVSVELQVAQIRLDEDFIRIGNAHVDVPGLKAIEKGAFFEAISDVDISFADIAALDGVII